MTGNAVQVPHKKRIFCPISNKLTRPVSVTEVFECRFKVVDVFREYALGVASYFMSNRVEHNTGSDHGAELLEYGFGIGASMLWGLAFLDTDGKSKDITTKVERNW